MDTLSGNITLIVGMMVEDTRAIGRMVNSMERESSLIPIGMCGRKVSGVREKELDGKTLLRVRHNMFLYIAIISFAINFIIYGIKYQV